MKLVRRLRVLEYVGSEEWVNAQINSRSVRGRLAASNGSISEAWIGDTNELLNPEEMDVDQ